jgi:hypothetical protein
MSFDGGQLQHVSDAGSAIRTVPLVDPTPLYAWSLIWRRDDHHPLLPELAEAFAAAGRGSRWLDYRPSADWLPDPDRAQAHVLFPNGPDSPPGKGSRGPCR